MSTKFTQGPWTDGGLFDPPYGDRIIQAQIMGYKVTVATVIPFGDPDSKSEQTEANAALIAECPAMYALLKQIFQDNDNDLRTATRMEVEALLARHEA